jgi:Mrp family chromosome partitioning ATPase
MLANQDRGHMQDEGRDIRELLRPLRRRWWMLVLVAVAIGAVSYYHYRDSVATYDASTTVFVERSSVDTVLGSPPSSEDPDRNLANQAGLVQTPAAAEQVARKLKYKGDPRALLSQVKVTPVEDSDFLRITATSPDPRFAADLANGFAAVLTQMGTGRVRNDARKARAEIERQLSQLAPTRENRAVRNGLEARLDQLHLIETLPTGGVRRIDRAVPPAMASGSSPVSKAIFAAVLGLILGAMLVYVLEALDRRLPSSRLEAEYGLPLLAAIPLNRKAAAQAQRHAGLPVQISEPVRTVRTTLDHGGVAGSAPRTILVTSALPGEGKTTLTKSLAVGFFEGGRNVLLIDADLRRPTLHRFFGVEPEQGLSDVLRSTTSLSSAVHAVAPLNGEVQHVAEQDMTAKANAVSLESKAASNGHSTAAGPVLHLLASGGEVADPAALLGSVQMARLLAEAAATYDVVLIDSSPLLAVSDVVPLATSVDGVIVVTRSQYTTREAAQSFRKALERLPDVTVVGLVANGVRDSTVPQQYRYVPGV